MSTKKELEIQDKLAAEMKKDLRMVRGVFKNYEAPGNGLKFSYKKYKTVPDKEWSFEHNKTYEVPLYIAKHINSRTFIRHKWLLDEAGKPDPNAGKEVVHRFGFHSVDFDLGE